MVQVHVSSLLHILSYIHYVIQQCIIKHKALFTLSHFLEEKKTTTPGLVLMHQVKVTVCPRHRKVEEKIAKENAFQARTLDLPHLPHNKSQRLSNCPAK